MLGISRTRPTMAFQESHWHPHGSHHAPARATLKVPPRIPRVAAALAGYTGTMSGFLLLLASTFAADAAPDPAAVASATATWRLVETGHLRVRAPGSVDLDAYARQEEEAVRALLDFFGGPLSGKIEVYAWTDEAEALRVLGQPLAFAVPSALTVHTSPTHTPGHELTHIVLGDRFPGRWNRFVGEGSAVAFDLTGRDRLTLAREAVKGAPTGSVRDAWTTGAGDEAWFYPIAGAFADRLAHADKAKFLALLADPTYEGARKVYGAELDRLIDTFQADIGPNPSPDALRARARARMLADKERFTPEQLAEIEGLYKRGDRKTEAGRAALAEIVTRFPASNRAGCAMLYLARAAQGAEQDTLLRRAFTEFDDTWYGDGTRVGAYARTLLALRMAKAGKNDEARELAAQVAASDPDAIDHGGGSLMAQLRQAGLVQ